ncbi:MAG TPA: ABC transporter permease [Actinomycetota bacterium]
MTTPPRQLPAAAPTPAPVSAGGGTGTDGAVSLGTRAGHGPIELPAERSWWQRHGETAIVWAFRVLLLAAVLVAWQLASGRLVDELFASKPSAVAHRLAQWSGDGTLWSNTWLTIQEILVGYLLGASTGVLAGFALASQRIAWRVLEPFVMALYSIPKVALAPLFIVWLGIGLQMKVLVAAVSVFFLVFINTAAGIRGVDRGLVDAVRLMGGSRRDIALKVILPGAMAGVLTGLRVAIPYALIGAVIAELVASNRGLGYLINDAAARFDTAGVFAALVVLSVIASVLGALVSVLGRFTNRWKPIDERH